MAIRIDMPSNQGGKAAPAKQAGGVLQKVIDVVAPPAPRYTLRPAPQARQQAQSGPSYAERQAQAAAAAAAEATRKAMAAGKSQTAKENSATQGIIDALIRGALGFEKGRDTLVANADRSLQASLAGIGANYSGAVQDYMKTGLANDQDESSKTAANIANRARERMSLLEQAASMGAGETDQLRAQLQAFQNFDANALEINRGFFDTARSIDSQIQGANSQAMTNRRSAWQQAEEARGNAWNEFYKNHQDTWTNVQRTIAQNSNIDSDYSTGFVANIGGRDLLGEVGKYAGMAYETRDKDKEWYEQFEGRVENREARSTATNRAAATTVSAPKAAEGATLRRRT